MVEQGHADARLQMMKVESLPPQPSVLRRLQGLRTWWSRLMPMPICK